jgi:tRNA pseudouridine55 synthase
MAEDKEYEGTVTLGRSTSTQDREGDVIEEKPVPDLSAESIEDAFARFDGDFHQIPPMVSAIKKDGVRLYKLARQGQDVEREPRLVHVYAHEIKRIALPDIDFRVVCSKGFYVRTYAHDVGHLLGCGGHLSSLRRTRSGRFTLARSVDTGSLLAGQRQEVLQKLLSLPEVSRLRGA